MGKPGRPSIYTSELATRICHRIADGETLKAICQDSDMPADSTVRLWVVEDREGFSALYARARQAQALKWAEEIIEIADDTSRDWKVDEKGNLIVEGETVMRSRVRIDTRKWLLAKLIPRVYGEKQTVQHEGSALSIVNIIASLPPDQVREIYALPEPEKRKAIAQLMAGDDEPE